MGGQSKDPEEWISTELDQNIK